MNKYFLGVEVSKTGIENGCVDLETLGKVINGISSDKIVENASACGITWALVNGSSEDCRDVYQWYVISKDAAKMLMRKSREQIVLYCEDFDLYAWGITTYGVAWEDVLTDIAL